MKLIVFFIVIACLKVSANAYGQNITIAAKQEPIEKVFAQIEKQTSYQFWYKNNVLKDVPAITLTIESESLQKVLDSVFSNQHLSYEIVGKTIVVKRATRLKKSISELLQSINITGKVVDESGQPLPGATIKVKGSSAVVSTNVDGAFQIENVATNAILQVSFIGYELKEVPVTPNMTISLVKVNSKLDEVQVIGYGTSSRRLNTGSVTKVTAEEISQQDVGNPLQALGGRVPGLFVQSNGGMAGSNLTVQLRGVNSIAAGNDPLYIIDGVPFGSASLDLIGRVNGNLTGGLSPLNSINPSDIESIEILKDADATAIYGSRAANGVILVTTKKGKDGKTRVSVDANHGIGKVSRFINVLGIDQYLQLRKMAFANNNITPTTVNAPDLLTWDQDQDTDWQKEILGGIAQNTNIQTSISGGNAVTRFVLSGGYRSEGSVLPADVRDNKANARLSVEHTSTNKKFYANASLSYSSDINTQVTDPTPYINLPPNYPIYDINGKVIWRPGAISEPYALLLKSFDNRTKSILGNAVLQYTVGTDLKLKVNLGYNDNNLDQSQKTPITSQNPALATEGRAYFGENEIETWNIEPQVTYSKAFSFGTIQALLGTTFQQTKNDSQLLLASNYSSDVLLGSIASAGNLSVSNNNSVDYRYTSIFGRINYDLSDKYLFNFTFRRDGSSRFGPNKQFGNFGAVGAAWVFSSEDFVKSALPFLSFGKFRGSYGITGNDQITDYQYLSSYTATTYAYQVSGLRPTRIANPDYSWETNKKLEVAIDLGLLKDRVLFSASYYRNHSGNMLVNYPLAGQAGFISYQANLPASVQNTGIELTLSTENIKSKLFSWTTGFNLTIPRNKLLAFPNIQSTSYGTNNLVVGQSLNLVWGYHYLGVDPQTGNPLVQDIDNSGTISSIGDYKHFGTTLPRYYGGLTSNFKYGKLEADILFQFANKISQTPIRAWLTVPGTITNLPSYSINGIWKQVGDNAQIPKATTSGYANNYTLSDVGSYEDASYLKLKSVNISYRIERKWVKKIGMQSLKFYLQAQNLFTVTGYSGLDPETAGPVLLPNLRVFVTGIKCDF